MEVVGMASFLAILTIATASVGINCVRKQPKEKKGRTSNLVYLSLMIVSAIITIIATVYMGKKKAFKNLKFNGRGRASAAPPLL